MPRAVILTNPTSGKGRGARMRDEAIPRLAGGRLDGDTQIRYAAKLDVLRRMGP